MSKSIVVGQMQERASKLPEKLAFAMVSARGDDTLRMTYAQLHRAACAVAALLATHSRPGDRVLLLYDQGLEFVQAFMGCLYAGRVALTAFPPRSQMTADRLDGLLANATAALTLTTGAVADRLGQRESGGQTSLPPFHLTDELSHAEGAQPPPPPDASQLALLQYTSGSTGTPKGVMVSHANLAANLEDIDRSLIHDMDSVMVSWLPVFHDMGLVYGILMPIYKGFPCYLMAPGLFLQRPLRWLQAISQYRATHTAAPNFAYDLCVQRSTARQRAGLDLTSLRVAVNGAEPVRPESLALFTRTFAPYGFDSRAFCPSYGMAEATLKISCVSAGERAPEVSFDSDGLLRGRVVPSSPGSPARVLVGCGPPPPGQLLILDEAGHLCHPLQVGEIWVKGPSIAQGYWARPQETREDFQAFVEDSGTGPFLRTGDLGFVWQGSLFICGRRKDLIIIRGGNYYPQDLEALAQASHAGTIPEGSAAFSIEVAQGEALVMVQEVAHGYESEEDLAAISAAIHRNIVDAFGIAPHTLVLVRRRSLEKTTSGKIKRRACRQAFLDGALKTLHVKEERPADPDEPPGRQKPGPIGQWLRAYLARRSGLAADVLDGDQPFSCYGLDSAGVAEMAGAMEKWLGHDLSPTLFYDYPTIARLEAFLTVAAPSPAAMSEPVDAEDPVAIIGLGCRFPGALDPDAFWALLEAGRDAIGPLPLARRHRDDAPGPAGYLEDVTSFDAAYFGISAAEAAAMDPQQRLLLEVTWETICAAGIEPSHLGQTQTGVFIGISSFDHARLAYADPGGNSLFTGTGNALSIAANRISYLLDLRGPSLAIDTACSSALVAVHQACRSLQSGECSAALAGGVNLILSGELTQTFALAGMLSPAHRCKTFDASADGYVRGEGCGMVLLKRLEDARAAGDPILAVIHGSAINQDGRAHGLTAPRGPAQQEVIRAALSRAGWQGGCLDYVEAHGSGTPLGDPIELNSLIGVLMEGRDQRPCQVGSVKTNIGHLEAAAGIAGLIKTVLALNKRVIPPHLHFRELNQMIHLTEIPVHIPTRPQPWPAPAGPRRAGVSAFGFGGTNAHLVLEEAPAAAGPARSPLPAPQWQRRHWPLPHPGPTPHPAAPATGHPLLGTRLALPESISELFIWQAAWHGDALPGIRPHPFLGTSVLPATAMMEMALAAARDAFGADEYELHNLDIHEALFLPATGSRHIQTVLRREGAGFHFSLHARSAAAAPDQPWTQHAAARIVPAPAGREGAGP